MQDCFTCAYAERDRHGRFLYSCAGYGNCSYAEYEGWVKPWPIEQMQKLLNGAVVSEFVSKDACVAFRDAVSKCIAILEAE